MPLATFSEVLLVCNGDWRPSTWISHSLSFKA